MQDCCGDILLLGEGDFSFTVAFANKLKGRKNSHVTATTLLKEEKLKSTHKLAAANIQTITQLGVSITYGVDATALEENDDLAKSFNYIIFNFPHTGGKSNIKNNRKLLKNMFSSVKAKLQPRGEVMVSLCNGQGGCPLEEKVRSWPDSWQIISMAAYSDFILKKVVPFDGDYWAEYSSTGFKSLDRHFHTTGSLTYIFVKSPRTGCSTLEETTGCAQINGHTVLVNKYLQPKLSRNLLLEENHPLNVTVALLEKLLTCENTQLKITHGKYLGNKVITCRRYSNKSDCISDKSNNIRSNSEVTTSQSSSVEDLSVEAVESHRDDFIDAHYSVFTTEEKGSPICSKSDSNSSWDSITSVELENQRPAPKVMLRTTLFEDEHLLDPILLNTKNADSIYTCYGDVYRRTWLNGDSLPVQHEFLMIGTSLSDKKQVQNLLHLDILFSSSSVGDMHFSDLTDENLLPKTYRNYLKIGECWSIEVDYASVNTFTGLSCNQISARGGRQATDSNHWKNTQLSKVVGYGGKVNMETLVTNKAEECDRNSPEDIYAVVLNLDALAQVLFDIPDVRLLWSENPEFLSQYEDFQSILSLKFSEINLSDHTKEDFSEISGLDSRTIHTENSTASCSVLSSSLAEKICRFKPVSFFPPLWRHDVSFWENDQESFSEEKFLDLLLDVAGDSLQQIILMNIWKDPYSQRTSRCYRQIYQSLDRAISHDQAHSLQNVIRLRVEKEMHIELR